jgi:hypothetical protein
MLCEAAITVNGAPLSDDESRAIRMALLNFAGILAVVAPNDYGMAIKHQYQTDVDLVRALIDGGRSRTH